MMKLLLLVFYVINVFSMEIDYKTLEEIISNDPKATKEKFLLAKYYANAGNDLKALTLVNQILKLEPSNKNALGIKKWMQKTKELQSIFREAGLSLPINKIEAQKRLDSYYAASNYQFFSTLYQALTESKVKLDDSFHIKAAYIYLWDARYANSQKALLKLEQENNFDEVKIRADIYYYTGEYSHASKLYEKIYKANGKMDIAIKLINSYLYLGETKKAERMYNFLYRQYPKNVELSIIGGKLSSSKNANLLSKKKEFENQKTLSSLKAYATVLFAANKQDETVELIHEFNVNSASAESLALEAKYLIWIGNTTGALKILNNHSLNNDLSAKLMLGQIYSWNRNFEESKSNLNEVIMKTKDNRMLFEAKNALAHVYMWEKKDELAKKMFNELEKEQPTNKGIKEALMQLNNDYKGLLSIYEKKVKKSSNPGDVKYLAELYTLNKMPNKAIKQLKKYVKENPNDLLGIKALGVLLVNHKEYYQGFGYLEYYAAQKQTAKSSILLAKHYYWHGFSKEALDVLNSLLKKEQNNQSGSLIGENQLSIAKNLKADILKAAPRFTTSNSGATTNSYFDDLGKKQLFLADTLYFNSHYVASLTYFENYLQNHPNDHKARYRYAFALENAHEYAKAEGEFSLIFFTKDTPELKYHYAYNMMKNAKLEKAKKLLLKLKGEIYSKIDPKLNVFLESWKSSWQSMKFLEYSSNYSTLFLKNQVWAYSKQEQFSKLSYVSIGIYDPLSRSLGNGNYIIKFYQGYSSNLSADKGYKTLDISCDTNQTECRITKETWKVGEYKKELPLMPYIEKSLKEVQYLKKNPLALNKSKKKIFCLNQNLKSIMTLS